MKIIAVAALKGGVGKTNFVFNLAGILAQKKHKILVIDLDPQGSLSKTFKGIKIHGQAKELYNLKQPSIEKLIEKWNYDNLSIDIIPTDIGMTILEDEIHSRNAREAILKRCFIANFEFLEQEYDYIIFDTNPSINIINKNALLIADEIIVISDNSIHSLEAVNMLTSNWDLFCKDLEIKNNINTIVLNNFDSFKISKDFIEFINKSKFKDKVLTTKIMRRQSFKKSEITGIPNIFSGKPEADIYQQIYKELKNKGVI